jgi:integrase
MSVERTATGTWRVRWREGGRNRAKTCGTKADAKLFEAEITKRRRMGDLASLDSGKQTLQEFAESVWWPQYVRPHLERSTRESYASTWDRHIGPTLGGYPLRELTAPVLSRHFAAMRTRGVGPAAVRRSKAILQSCLSRAVADGLIQGNPAAAIKLPRAERKASVSAIGPTHVEALRASLSQRDAALASVLAYVGLRPGEALALRWGDIRERTINVERSNDDGQIKGTKTGHRRSARLMAPVKADLQAWRLASGRPDDYAHVFPNAIGNRWREHDWRNFRRRTFQPAVRALGLEITRPYDLRHAAASLWLHEGRSVVEVAAWLGHSPAMCLNTYAHVVEDLRDAPKLDAEQAIRAAREATYPKEETEHGHRGPSQIRVR